MSTTTTADPSDLDSPSARRPPNPYEHSTVKPREPLATEVSHRPTNGPGSPQTGLSHALLPQWSADHNVHAKPPTETKHIVLRLELHSFDGLMDVITTLARVGATTETLVAEKRKLVIGFVARNNVASRLPGLLRELIPVLDVEIVSRS